MVCRREHLLILKSYMLCRKRTFFLTDVLILKDRSSFFPHVTWFIGHLITLNYNSNLNQSDSEWSVSKSTLPVLHINEDRLLRGKLLSYGSLCRCMVTRPRFNEIAVQENDCLYMTWCQLSQNVLSILEKMQKGSRQDSLLWHNF